MHVMKRSIDDKIFHILNYIFLTVSFIVILFPLVNVISQSFSTPAAVVGGRVYLLPVGFNVDAYITIFSYKAITTGFLNSLFYTVFATMINIPMTVMAAYPLSRNDFVGKNVIILFFVFTMLFSGGLIPTYLLVQSLGLIDTRWAMLLPGALSVANMIICKNFFKTTIPEEMNESAELDGASDIRILISIILPLSVPIIAVLVMFYAVGHWNTYYTGLLYLRSDRLYNFQMILRNILASTSTMGTMLSGSLGETVRLQWLMERLKYAVIVVGAVPVLILYPFVQKHFIKGIIIGAVKG